MQDLCIHNKITFPTGSNGSKSRVNQNVHARTVSTSKFNVASLPHFGQSGNKAATSIHFHRQHTPMCIHPIVDSLVVHSLLQSSQPITIHHVFGKTAYFSWVHQYICRLGDFTSFRLDLRHLFLRLVVTKRQMFVFMVLDAP